MKKGSCLLLVLLLFFAGCGGNPSGAHSDASPSKAESSKEERVINPGPEGYTVADDFAGGTGTESDPFRIATAEQLARLCYLVNLRDQDDHYARACYILTEDIILNDLTDFANWAQKAPAGHWKPIGETVSGFRGTFDGNGHTISGMYLAPVYDGGDMNSYSDGSAPGLFGVITNGTVRNLAIRDSLIIVDGRPNYLGSLAAHVSNSTIENCSSTAGIIVRQNPVFDLGGLIGYADGSVSGCDFSGTIVLTDGCCAGGLIGTASGDHLLIQNCTSNAVFEAEGVLTDNTYAAGLIYNVLNGLDGRITGCRNNADIDLGAAGGSGLIFKVSLSDRDSDLTDGVNHPEGELFITDCINSGDITSTGNREAAGLVVFGSSRYNEDDNHIALHLSGCSNEGAITGNSYTAGIVGTISSQIGWEIMDCHNHGNVHSGDMAAGIIAQVESCEQPTTIGNCSNSGSVTTDNGHAGGILCDYFGFSVYVGDGKDYPLHITECENTGSIHGAGSSLGLGGIVGSLRSCETCVTIDNCINRGNLVVADTVRAGGILGDTQFSNYNTYTGKCFHVTNCRNEGDILHGDAAKIYDSESLPKTSYQEESGNRADGAELLIMGGPALGGVIGFLHNGSVDHCASYGTIYLDSAYVPVNENDVLMEAARGIHERILFAGGVCGLYLFYEGDSVEITSLRDCIYTAPAPMAFYAPISSEGTENNIRE